MSIFAPSFKRVGASRASILQSAAAPRAKANCPGANRRTQTAAGAVQELSSNNKVRA